MKTMQLHMTDEWLLKRAEEEGGGIISVGGLICRIEANAATVSAATERGALARLVEWQRRKLLWSVEELAERANVEVEDVLAVETGKSTPESRTVSQLAEATGLPGQKLMHLAGLVDTRDLPLERAVVRFAARFDPVEALTPDQTAALDEFVRAIAD